MKKKLALLLGAIMAFAGLSGCAKDDGGKKDDPVETQYDDFDPGDNRNQAVYGPPPELRDFNPEDNRNLPVYGPPPAR